MTHSTEFMVYGSDFNAYFFSEFVALGFWSVALGEDEIEDTSHQYRLQGDVVSWSLP